MGEGRSSLSIKTKKDPKANRQTEPVRKEIWGIVFFLFALILGVSLFSYHPGDPLLWKHASQAAKIHNLFGTLGAHLADGIFRLLGFSSFWLPLIFLSFSFLSFRGRYFSSPIKSLFAGLLLIFSFSGILALQMPNDFPYKGGEVMSGGLIGDLTARSMKEFLNYFGAYVLLTAIFIVSLMVCTHISFGWVFSKLDLWLSILIRRIKELVVKKREKRRKKRAREKTIQEKEAKPKSKVVIVEPPPEPPKPPEQESFAFMNVEGEFQLPSLDLLNDLPQAKDVEIQRESLEMNARRVEKKLSDFGVHGEVAEIHPGPVITMYEYQPAPGIKISKVASLADDLALALRAPSIRIVAPIPGKAAIGIEIPNNQRDPVYLNEILASQTYANSTSRLAIALGKDITGAPVITDLTRMPHLLVAGATGTGKSVSLNAMINSLLFSFSPDSLRFLMIDPKRIELSIYQDIPHLLYPVVTQPSEATRLLRWTVREMERRYALLSEWGVRNIETYNRKILKEEEKGKPKPESFEKEPEGHLPYIVLVIDELADLMMTSSREVEEAITRLAQMARAAGIHLIIATQRPSVDVLTGIIKANFPARISFQVSSRVDSRTILDTIGAEHLLGDGDMLFMPPGVGKIMRIHGAYISEEEIKRVTAFLREQMKPDYDTTMLARLEQEEETDDGEIELDEKYDQAVEIVAQTGQASISMLQRRLRVGYNRAARMIEAMEREGIVGPSDGVRPREVFARRRDD
jgi:S-DNA-T family DNA segregation ATPase FtsK/SpoIIIE